jgi:hypothetical protein
MFRNKKIYKNKALKLVKFHIPFLLSHYFPKPPPPPKKKGLAKRHRHCVINEQMPGNFGMLDIL